MRIYIWHGYLLSGTGSNEYTRALARTLARQGHDVTVFCQDPAAADFDLAGAATVRPDLPGHLPVFVLDSYSDARPALVGDLPEAELDAFVAANAAAITAAGPADLLIANHLVLGGPVAAATGLPYIVKAHGSELEYAMRDNPRLCRWAEQTLADSLCVLAGSEHIKRVIGELVDVDASRIAVVPPGVDTDQMRPRPAEEALAGLLAETALDRHGDQRLPDPGNAERFASFFAGTDRPRVVYVGKLSEEKGVPMLVEVLDQLSYPALIVGFGPARASLQATAGPNIHFTGPLQHRHLQYLWPLMDVSVVPSVFPEAFGMVAAEAAACGCPPLVADHSGLAEIAAGIRSHYPPGLTDLAAFPKGDHDALARRLKAFADLSAAEQQAVAQGARAAALDLWGWDSVAHR
ncbi:MAG TPA: glycosyltransferase family 4 protein, partial [Actinomycetota bacterium]|nr:glycosyltransferase family 4 protein [Actinomycetota bacterium]